MEIHSLQCGEWQKSQLANIKLKASQARKVLVGQQWISFNQNLTKVTQSLTQLNADERPGRFPALVFSL
jgi:hypothetical protein